MGTSGGVWGLERGYCLMIGGEADVVKRLDPIFQTLAPGRGDIPRTEGREKRGGTAELGYLHCGPNGAGHFVKMIHNGIEYGLMAAYAEGLNILKKANIGKGSHEHDAETIPLRNPEHYQFDFDLADVTEVWRRGSVVTSWLLDLTASALIGNPTLEKFAGKVSDSGEGRWTIAAANDEAVPAHVLTAALFERFASRGEDDFQNRVLSARRSATSRPRCCATCARSPLSTWCAGNTAASATNPASPKTRTWRPTQPCACTSTRGAGRGCPFMCVPARRSLRRAPK